MQFTITTLPEKCANLLCVNKSHEGKFVMLNGDSKDGQRVTDVRLWVCSPCAELMSQEDKERKYYCTCGHCLSRHRSEECLDCQVDDPSRARHKYAHGSYVGEL